ncbi:MAG TPA: hypothetical protein VFR17_05370 [Mycobacterium sp.]|nr:hypothetical protein [Mycobacterium sp.]
MPNRRRHRLSTTMSAVAALAVASPFAIAAVSQVAVDHSGLQHREFVPAAYGTDLPGELIGALSQGLSQFGVNVPPAPGLTSPGLTPGLTSPALTSPGLTSPGLTSPGLTSPGLGAGNLPGTGLLGGGDMPLGPTGLDGGLDPGLDGTYPILGDPSLGAMPATSGQSGGLVSDLMSAANQLGASQAIDLLKSTLIPSMTQAAQGAAAPAAAAAAPAAEAAAAAPAAAAGAAG